MKHIYKIFLGFLAGGLVLGFQNCAENIDYSQYSSSSSLDSAVPAAVLNMPATQSYKVGQSLLIEADVQGTNVQLQWYKGTTKLTGKTSRILSINNLQLDDAATYKLQAITVEPPAEQIRSTKVTVTEDVTTNPTPSPTPTPTPTLPAAPQITSQPKSMTMQTVDRSTFFRFDDGVAYYDANFTVSATGSGLKYQWYRKTVGASNFSAISGATSRIYAFNMNSMSQAGLYKVQVTDQYDRQVMSSEANLSVDVIDINIGYPYSRNPNDPQPNIR